MVEKSLFEALLPLITMANYLFGVNSDVSKAEGWREIVTKVNIRLTNCGFIITFLCTATSNSGSPAEWNKHRELAKNWVFIIMFFSFYVYFFIFDESKMKTLLRHFRSHPVAKTSLKVIFQFRIVFAVYLVITIATFIAVIMHLVVDAKVQIDSKMAATFVRFVACVVGFNIFTIFVFPLFLCSLTCAVAAYCSTRLSDVIEEMRGAKSTLRKSKMAERVMREYKALKQLALLTDDLCSKVMTSLRMVIVILVAEFVNYIASAESVDDYKFSMVYCGVFSQYFAFLLIYLKVAPQANKMSWMMRKSLIEYQLLQDERVSRDPILRLHLMKKRFNTCVHISQENLSDEPFTISGSAVDGEDFFAVFIEINDTINTFSANEPKFRTNIVVFVISCLTFFNDKLIL